MSLALRAATIEEHRPVSINQPDLAIIGAGIFGLAAARAALRRGLTVVVHEAAAPGAGASGGLIGALSPHLPERWNEKKALQFRALIEAEAYWSAIAAESGLPTGYRRGGRVLPLHNARARELAEARAIEAQTLWEGKASWSIVEDVPYVAPAAFGYVAETLSAQIAPDLALSALAKAVRQAGGLLADAAQEVTSLAPQVIVAAGHRSGELCPTLPPDFISGVKGQSALLQADLPRDFPILFDNGVYIVRQPNGVAVGSTSEKEWQGEETDALLDPVIQQARALVPALADAPVITRWAGIRPRARFPDPALGEVTPSVWLMTGGFKIGLGLAPVIGEAIIAMMLGEETNLPDRFHLDTQLALG